jgi:hypothetical protein
MKRGILAEELQSAFGVGDDKTLAHEAAKQSREHLNAEEVTWPARYPALTVGREAATRYDTMNVGMMDERRAPSVQHHGDADLGAQMLGIGGNREQGLRCRLEQGVVDHRLIGVGDVGDLRR